MFECRNDTPEQLTKAEFLDTLAAGPIDLFVIDEAHCISQWGHDFRPAYRALGGAIRALGSPTVLALTATAPQAVVDDIIEQLALDELRTVNLGLFRQNLQLTVEPATSDAEKTQTKAARAVRERRGIGFRLRRDLAPATVVSMAETYDAKARHDADKLQRMVSYAQTALCRWKLLLGSLEEPPSWAACGLCDNCRGTASLASGIAEGA